MTIEELKEIIARDECETIEFKESTGQRVDACETLCAFLNRDGGTVVFGVTRKGKLTGLLVADTTKRDLFEAFQKFEPAADVEVAWVPVDETHQAIVCRVERGNGRPYVYDGKPYKRVQSSTTVMSQEEYEKMLRTRGGFRSKWESVPNPELALADLDAGLICETARRAVRCGRLDEGTDTDDVEGLLDGFKLRKGGVLLNGAAVLFGRPEKIDYPQLEVRMGWFKGTDDRMFLDNRHVQGNIFKLIDESMAFCFKHLNLSAKISGKIERDEELEIPADALREVLINAFAHRSYEESNRTVYLAIYDDRVEIKNPGRFPPDFDVANLYSPPIKNSLPRNEKIARVLYLRKTIETWGRGLTRIASECQRVGLPLPTTTAAHGNVLTVFQRPGWSRTGTMAGITGTTNTITGTMAGITGTRWVVVASDPMVHLPNLRKDARANAEAVLDEIIADNTATIPEICARTGMALRTINNAIATLRDVGIIQSGDIRLGFKGRSKRKVKGQEVGGKGCEDGAKGREDGSKEGEVGSKIDFDIILSNVRKDFRETCRRVWELLNQDETLLQQGVSERLNIALNSVQKAYAVLKNAGLLIKEGEGRGSKWIVNKNVAAEEAGQ